MIEILSFIGFKFLFSVLALCFAFVAYYYQYVFKGQIIILHKEPSNSLTQPSQEETPQLDQQSFHNKILKEFELNKKDSLTEHLDALANQLAEKESKLHISKSRILETEVEIESLHVINNDVRSKYQDIMGNLKKDLQNNELECRRLQEEIEWVSKKRGELRDEVRLGHHLYGKVANDLTMNLTELQRGRVVDKPTSQTNSSPRHRPYPHPKITPVGSLVMKSVHGSPESSLSSVSTPIYYQ